MMYISELTPIEIEVHDFKIKPERFATAFAEVMNRNNGCSFFEGASDLSEIFYNHGFEVEMDEQNGIYDLSLTSNDNADMTDIINLFDSIAPFVEAGSCIEFSGSERGRWRHFFDGKTVSGHFPDDLVWPLKPLTKNYYYGFTCSTRQSYWEDIQKDFDYVDEVVFGMNDIRGGTKCEFAVRWYIIDKTRVPRLEAFPSKKNSVGHEMLKKILTVILDMEEDFTSEDFSRKLIQLGFKDLSDTKI